ncbi:MAG: bifunctional UDP-N-acetylglucosamine diphosphorylase/glucosamine-1-phosphate N-acetyltransferase GlmU [Deltaproteobacteria bacterium]
MKGISAIILAAGQGRRMKSALPKVAHLILGKPVVWHVARAARAAGIREMVFVLGYGRDKVLPVVEAFGGKVAIQESQFGTGDAARCGLAELSAGAKEVVVLCGDAPLLRSGTIRALLSARRRANAPASVLTGVLDDPTGYGRIVRGPDGAIARIVEEKDANASQRRIREVNSGTYAFDRVFLERGLPRISDVNAQREYYLTDLVLEALAEGTRVVPVVGADPDETRGINSRRELAEATRVLVERKLEDLMASGVTVVDPRRTCVETEVTVGQDTVIDPGVSLLGKTRIGRGVRIGTGCVVESSVVSDGVELKPYTVIEGSTVRKNAVLGPFSHLRPEADIGEGAHIGNFVEVKKSRIGKGSKANHLSYLGDATVGKKVNVGAGTITCNYDGIRKHPTVLGDGVFVGSDTMLVAPVTVGKGALIGAGSTITKNVPPFSLALCRAQEKVIEGWVATKRPELLKKAGISAPAATRGTK